MQKLIESHEKGIGNRFLFLRSDTTISRKYFKKLVKNAGLRIFNVEYIGSKIFGENVHGITYKT